MSNIVKKESAGISAEVNEALLGDYLAAMGLAKNLSEQERTQFLRIAQAYQLNPFKREIYATKYGNQDMSIIVGYEVYLKRAERTGQLAGWSCVTEGSVKEGNLKAVCTIYRKDREHPFVWEVWYDECVQTTKDGNPTRFWKKARFMTKKVCISQTFRLAFPDELGGLPYTSDEIANEQTVDTPYLEVKEPMDKADKEKAALISNAPDPWKPTEIQLREYNAHFGTGLFSEAEVSKFAYRPAWTEGQFKAALKAIQKKYVERKEAGKDA